MNKNKITGYVAVGLCSAAITFGICWYTMDYSRRDAIRIGEKMVVVNECREILEKASYPLGDDDPDSSAINGYISAFANDDFTYYIKPSSDAVADMTTYVNSSGTAVASGFKVDADSDGNILITDIVKGLAADKQGLKKGDVIIAINGSPVAKSGYENIANKLLGKQGTKVDLTIRRDKRELDIEFIRDHVYENYVDSQIVKGVGILTIKSIDQFGGGQFDQSVRLLKDCQNVVIDLRNNPGGDGAISMEWAARLSGNARVVKKHYNGETEELNVEGAKDFGEKKVVILTNAYTASAAEMFCAIITQNLDATIVGTKTYGKGIFQQYADLSDGGQLRYTAGSFTVGDWECWQGVGISPDVEVQMDPALIGTDDDIQLKKAMELLD